MGSLATKMLPLLRTSIETVKTRFTFLFQVFRGTWKMLTARHLVLGLWRLCRTEQIYCLKYTAESVTCPCMLHCCNPLEESNPNRVPHTYFCKFIKQHSLKTQRQGGKYRRKAKSYSSSSYMDQTQSFYLCLHLVWSHAGHKIQGRHTNTSSLLYLPNKLIREQAIGVIILLDNLDRSSLEEFSNYFLKLSLIQIFSLCSTFWQGAPRLPCATQDPWKRVFSSVSFNISLKNL